MKKILFILLLSFQLFAAAATRVVFLNGIDGSAEDSIASQEKIAQIIKVAGFGVKFDIDNNIRYIYNSGDGGLGANDKDELLWQAKLSQQALLNARIATPTATLGSPAYIAHLGALYDTGIKLKLNPPSGIFDDDDEAQVYATTKMVASRIDDMLTAGHKVIIVAHSQGNFYAESTNAYLRHGKSIAQLNIYNDNLRFVGAASVAASTPNGRYISANEDIALNAHRSTTIVQYSLFELLPRNIFLCNVDLTLPACVLSLQGIHSSIHNFQKIYTSNLIDKLSGKTLATMLVEFVNASFDELNVQFGSAPVVPVTPSLYFISKTSNSISLQWTVPSNATSYVLTRSGTTFNVSGSSVADGSLSPNTMYSYSIKACNAAGCSGQSNVLNITTDAPAQVAPATPTLTFVSKTSSSVSLQWNTPLSATYFVLNRSGIPANRTGSSFVDNGVSPNTSYSYSLQACNIVGCSGSSNILYITTDAAAQVVPAAPALTFVNKTSSSVSLQWNTPATATYFVLNRSGILANRTGTSFVDNGVSSSTTYSYSLQACNIVGCSGSSNILYVTTDAIAPVLPVVNSVSLYNFNSANLTFYTGIFASNNTVAIINGSNLSQTTLIDIVGYTCNISAPLTASNFSQILFYTTGIFTSSGKSTYPSTSGFANQLAAVCSGVSGPTGTSVTVNVKSVSGGSNIYTTYATVQ